MAETHSLQELQSPPVSSKIFIQRDYSSGTICRFQTKFPSELENRVDKQQFEETIQTLNNLYAEAEKLGGHALREGSKEDLQVHQRPEREDLRSQRFTADRPHRERTQGRGNHDLRGQKRRLQQMKSTNTNRCTDFDLRCGIHRSFTLAFPCVDGLYLPKHESEFVHLVLEELETFELEEQRSRVLLFPPLPSRLRYLTHRTVEERPELCSFSVGENQQRRVAVCFCHIRGDVNSDSDVEENNSNSSTFHDEVKREPESKSKKTSTKNKTRTPRRPDQPLYQPRALRERLSDQNTRTETISEQRAAGDSVRERLWDQNEKTEERERRTEDKTPERERTEDTAAGDGVRERLSDQNTRTETISEHRAGGDSVRERLSDQNTGTETISEHRAAGDGMRERLWDQNVKTEPKTADRPERGRRTEDRAAAGGDSVRDRLTADEADKHLNCTDSGTRNHQKNHCEGASEEQKNHCEGTGDELDLKLSEEDADTDSPAAFTNSDRTHAEEEVWDEDVWTETETQRGGGSDAAHTSVSHGVADGGSAADCSTAAAAADGCSAGEVCECGRPAADSQTEELHEDEIRSFLKAGVSFCVSPVLVDLSCFQSVSVSLCDELKHVIEIYDFPALFKTEDLLDAFTLDSASGMKVQWVDNTHALGVFSCEEAALQALSLSHPLLKTRLLSEGSQKSQSKAMRRAEFLQPLRERPRTDCVVARRMVTRALGLQQRRGHRGDRGHRGHGDADTEAL
ncbi:hypothetical protein WMY93_011778 [Mugilogobius chulae]|uniref:R3H domain-containing protein n=1 Tax=Mugilogobius chulae TaxID=88201 RepID=A0AAW0P323_9GOBI